MHPCTHMHTYRCIHALSLSLFYFSLTVYAHLTEMQLSNYWRKVLKTERKVTSQNRTAIVRYQPPMSWQILYVKKYLSLRLTREKVCLLLTKFILIGMTGYPLGITLSWICRINWLFCNSSFYYHNQCV